MTTEPQVRQPRSAALRELFAIHEEILRNMPDWKKGSPVNYRVDDDESKTKAAATPITRPE